VEYIYHDRTPGGLETTKLATTRLLISKLATALILCFYPSLNLFLAQLILTNHATHKRFYPGKKSSTQENHQEWKLHYSREGKPQYWGRSWESKPQRHKYSQESQPQHQGYSANGVKPGPLNRPNAIPN